MGSVSNHQRNVGPMQAVPRCGARTRSGAPCRSPCVTGSARCRMHGGKGSGAPRGNRNAFRHGCYSAEMLANNAAVRTFMRHVELRLQEIAERRARQGISEGGHPGDKI